MAATTSDPSASAAAPLARWKLWLFTAILLAIVLGILELMANVYLRQTRGYDGEHLYQYDYDAYKNILPARNFVDTRGIVHNSQGFRRATDVPVAKDTGTIRIFLMGASTAYGLGGLWPHLQTDFEVLKNSETIDAYLEKILAPAFPGKKVEVINAAITSTWTHHSLIYLNQTILRFHPDMVMFLDGYNDEYFTDPKHDQFTDYGALTPANVILGPTTIKSLGYAVGWWFFRESALVHVAARGASVIKKVVFTPKPPVWPMNVDSEVVGLSQTFPENALKMHRRSGLILRDEGVIPVFMLQPLLILERDRLDSMPPIEKTLFEFDISSDRPGSEEFHHRAVKVLHDDEQAMADEIGAHYIDLTGIYAGASGQIFTDYAHLTPRANEMLAQYVADRIEPLLAERVASGCLSGHAPTACHPVPAAPANGKSGGAK